jgi:molybdate transport system substrate-binding protein
MRRPAALALCLALAPPAGADTVTVFAAASLKESLDAVTHAFEIVARDKVTVSYAASNALARQIENGAPADVFISADKDWVDYLERRGLVAPGSRRNLLGNELVLVAPAESRVQLRLARGAPVAAALGAKRVALANPDAVPAGKYAKAAFTTLGIWPSVEHKVAAADNVRAALALVARGEAALGVVYRSDAMAEPNVRVVDTFPAGSYPPIVYSAVILKRSTTPAAAALVDELASPRAMVTFRRFGFRAP